VERHRGRRAWSTLLALSAAACGAGGHLTPRTIAVLPLDTAGNVNAARVRRSIHDHLSRQSATTTVDLARVDRAIASAAGRRLGAGRVVAGALAGLGKTFVLQLRLVDVKRAAVIRALEESHFGSPSGLETVAKRMVDRLDLARRPPRSWYTRWWVWTIVGTALTAAAVTVPLALRDSDRYENITLP
jgi:hypothetical protein